MKKLKNKEQYLDARGRVDVQGIILSSLAIAGIVSIAVLAPNALQIVKLFKKDDRRYRNTYYINNTITKLKEKGLVVFEEVKGNRVVRLTEKGKKEYAKFTSKEKGLKKQRWDGKWRIVMFDIKEKRRYTRDKVRCELESIGFIKLQNSVWVYPYPCEDVIAMLKADARIGRDVLYIKAEQIEGDAGLRKRFYL